MTKGNEMPYFRFTAYTPYCGEEITEYIEIDEDSLADVDNIAADMAREVGDMFWDGKEDEEGNFSDGYYSEEDYYAEVSCSYDEISREEFEKSR
jgi:hypothetical protein